MDTNVNEEVDMDLLVKDNPDPIEDYKEEVNKDVVDQDPDPDQVVKADLEMDPAAATESFIRKNFGISVEELDEAADASAAVGEAVQEEVTNGEADTEDDLLGITPSEVEETVVTVTPPAGGDTTVTEDGGVPVEAADVSTATPEEVASVTEPETAAEVSSLENLRAILSRESDDIDDSGDSPDVSLNVETPNNNVDIDLEDKAVTIEPVDSDDSGDTDVGGSDDVPAPDTGDSEDTGSDESSTEDESNDEGSSDEGGESGDEEGSAESWWLI